MKILALVFLTFLALLGTGCASMIEPWKLGTAHEDRAYHDSGRIYREMIEGAKPEIKYKWSKWEEKTTSDDTVLIEMEQIAPGKWTGTAR